MFQAEVPNYRVRDFHIREHHELHSSSSAPPFLSLLPSLPASEVTIYDDFQRLHCNDAHADTRDTLLITAPLLHLVPQFILDAARLLPDLQNLQTSIHTLPDASLTRIPLHYPPRHHPARCRRHKPQCSTRTRAHRKSKPDYTNKGVEFIPDDPECSRRAGSRRGEAGVREQRVEGTSQQSARW